MALPHLIEDFAKWPGMYCERAEFDQVAAYLNGCNLASNGGLLSGFREWLIVKAGRGENLVWFEVALYLIFPDAESPRKCLVQSGNQKLAVEKLFQIIEEYWNERNESNGMRRIYSRYESWIRSQEWYEPGCPDDLERDSKLRQDNS